MDKNKLGKDGPLVSPIGLGCMGMSDMYGSHETRNDNNSIETIQAALNAGVNFLDTGDYYGAGHNELLIREAIKGRKARPVISVKFGALRSPDGAWLGFDMRPAAVKNFASYSLKRLNVEAIDIYQPGRIARDIPIEDTVGAIADLIKEGKVKYLGLSEANADMIKRAHNVHPVTAVEVEYSIATRVIEREVIPVCRELGIGIVAYGVLGRGLLTGELNGNFHPGDIRNHSPRFTGKNFEENNELIKILQGIAYDKGCTPAQLAIAWVLHQGNDILPLIGTTKKYRLNEAIDAMRIKLTNEELDYMSTVFAEGKFSGSRYPDAQMGMVVN